jgi:cytochrome b561
MKRRTKNYINYILELFLFISILGVVISSYIVWFVLPRGVGTHGSPFCSQWGYGGQGNYWTVLGWPRYIWIEIHNWLGVALAAILLVHIILHWKWIVETTKRAKIYIIGKMSKVKELYIAAVALFVLFLFEVLSGCIIWLILPRGRFDYYNMLSGGGRTFWGLQRNIWADLHGWLAITIAAIIVIHVVMNWSWVVATTKNIFWGVYRSLIRITNIR